MNEQFDLIAFGRPFIANPDFVSQLANQQPMVEYNADMLAQLY